MLRIEGYNSQYQAANTLNNSVKSEGKKVHIENDIPPVNAVLTSGSQRPESFRISEAFAKINAQSTTSNTVVLSDTKGGTVSGHERFDAENVFEAVNKYVSSHQLETSVSVALHAHMPKVKDAQVTLFVDNDLQKDKVKVISSHLLAFLKKALNNADIELMFALFDNSKPGNEKHYFTSSEKFQHFMEINPAVKELQKLFGLEIE